MSWLKPLPQILPPPKFPIPKTSKLADKLAASLAGGYRMKDGHNRVLRWYKGTHYGGVLSFKRQKIAIYVQENSSLRFNYLFLNEPPIEMVNGIPIEENLISRLILFDRFNAILKYINKLPTLHEIVPNYWIFSDGVPWNGRRLFRFRMSLPLSEKEILTNYVFSRP